MKICFKCKIEKPLCDYYKHSQMPDGHLNKCKECTKHDVRKNRESKIDYYREYDKKRFQKDPKVRERHKRYQKTSAGKESLKRTRKKWLENNAVKRTAHILVNNKLRDGTLKKPQHCECCGESKKRINGHHDDYTKPLEVRWLCCLCHAKWHKENGEGKF